MARTVALLCKDGVATLWVFAQNKSANHELKRREATDADCRGRALATMGEDPYFAPIHAPQRRRRRAAERAQEHSPSIMAKRGAGSELTKDNYEREIEREGSEEAGTWQKADEVRLASRLRLPPRSTC